MSYGAMWLLRLTMRAMRVSSRAHATMVVEVE